MTTTTTTKSTDLKPGDTIRYGNTTVRVANAWSWTTESGYRSVGLKLAGFIGTVHVSPHDTFEVLS